MKKTNKVLLSVMTIAGATGCSNETTLPPKPNDSQCRDYEFDYDEGVWECDDSSSAYYRHYYYGGNRYATRSELRKDANYKKYVQSDAFKKGFGSGSKVSGS
ncbi:aminotransferase yhxA [Ectobacillus antri]|jgi:hypothetical protein|uniref:Aminotransferase yhxA n=1 Tax=Ectobacillus antri TaxID=2486280 RepID=A0ABT6GZF3_9BACI|nr:aminotransferase yhxA [Ectobacillus antri]MDG4655725.1 aminotransferase yhxA [Ectobacillus antri]MDG5752400.1 aminotransferase yhxA [Ectobacillus antri]